MSKGVVYTGSLTDADWENMSGSAMILRPAFGLVPPEEKNTWDFAVLSYGKKKEDSTDE